MKSFPKKYNPQELHDRAKQYRTNINKDNNNYVFSLWDIPISQKLSYQDFFYHYTRDFLDYLNNRNHWESKYQQLFITSNDQLKNICSGYDFFNQKKQTLSQVWINKFERRMISTSKKNLNANIKILDNYLSSTHKIYVPDSELYLYVLDKFHQLRENGKITYDEKIWYRSFKLQTSIPPQHITWKEEKKPYYILKYFVWAKCEALPVCLEDIDLCCWDVALLVHPKDKRYNKYIWKNAIIPLCNRQIPIIGDENVNIALNNWIQRICPCSDQDSIKIAEKYWLPTDIFVFNKEWLYTDYIHESAFIWQERDKYYNNIEWFMKDIWNLERKWERVVKVPYLAHINERLTPYKIQQVKLDLSEEKQSILTKIFNHEIHFEFLDPDFWDTLYTIESLQKKLEESPTINENIDEDYDEEYDEDEDENTNNIQNKLQTKISELKQKIINKFDKYLPDYLICNSQLPYWRRLPLIKNSDWEISFFDIEKDYINRKDNPTLTCFNYIILSLVRIWVLWNSWSKDDKLKLCELKNFIRILSENEKKILYFIKHLSEIMWEKSQYDDFSQMVQNLTDEVNSSSDEFLKLVKKSKLLEVDGNWILLNLSWISNDTIDNDFIQLCIPCYIQEKGIKINNQIIFNKDGESRILKELLLQELILWKNSYDNLIEFSYDEENEFLWDKQMTKLQWEQSQRDLFSLYWENPIRLNLLIDKTYDQKEILLNNIFLKQIWNATRLCMQKKFLPENIEKCLDKIPNKFNDFDIPVLDKLNDLYREWERADSYEEYTKFFRTFKESIQNTFFSRYLEIQKVNPTKEVQFVCSYFFNFLLTILYPLVPEFVDALQYVSEKDFLKPILPIQLDKNMNYEMKVIYNAFIKIKELKIELNIKQHEPCNIFIKSPPAIWNIFAENEQIFKNYFHISEISYIRLHEPNPLGYETFSDEVVTLWIQSEDSQNIVAKDSIESIEKEIKDLDDKLNLLRQRLQILPEWEDRKKAEKEFAKTKEEMENLSIKYSLLSSK